MLNNSVYFYMRLKENFFDSEEVVIIEGMEKGYTYEVILLKMYLKSLKGNGRLVLTEDIPYTVSMLAKVIRHTEEDVKEALEIFSSLGLVEIIETTEAIYMTQIQNYIGKSSTEGDRKREYRRQIEAEKTKDQHKSDTSRTNVQTKDQETTDESPDKKAQEIEKELEQKKEIEKEKEKELEFNHVLDNKTSEYFAMFKDNIGHDRPPMYTDFDNICKMFNEICKSFKPITDIETYTENHSKVFTDCAIKGYTEEDYRIAFNKAENNDYLKGQVEGKTEPSELSWMLERLDKIIGDGYRKY